MGLRLNSIRVMLEAKASGVDFTRTLTLGRQFFNCNPAIYSGLLSRYCLPETQASEFAEPFLKALGAKEVRAIDYSDYEGAEIIHDLNNPVPPDLREQFDTVFDTGSLEHVFNFPVSIKNCMDMVKVGGHLTLFFPMNNFCGHGFYQFSPELFFRTLSTENGFEIENAIAFEDHDDAEYFQVLDPATSPPKGKPTSRYPIVMFVQARKLRSVSTLVTPQQSQYAEAWTESAKPSRGTEGAGVRRIISTKLPHLANAIRSWQRRRRSDKSPILGSSGFRPLGREPIGGSQSRDA